MLVQSFTPHWSRPLYHAPRLCHILLFPGNALTVKALSCQSEAFYLASERPRFSNGRENTPTGAAYFF